MFTVIMPSYLTDYVHGAKNRVLKFHRAVKSVMAQTDKQWQLIIIADGCVTTMTEAAKYQDERINVIYRDKQAWNSSGLKSTIGVGLLRNTGLDLADGEWIAYLDTDDFISYNHLRNLGRAVADYDWIWFNDYKWNPVHRTWAKSENSLRPFQHGTANIAHKKDLPVRWPELCKYGQDDMGFVNQLKGHKNYAKVDGGQYFICHVPKNPLFQNYDI